MPRTRPPYSPEFRQQMVELVKTGADSAYRTGPRGRLFPLGISNPRTGFSRSR